MKDLIIDKESIKDNDARKRIRTEYDKMLDEINKRYIKEQLLNVSTEDLLHVGRSSNISKNKEKYPKTIKNLTENIKDIQDELIITQDSIKIQLDAENEKYTSFHTQIQIRRIADEKITTELARITNKTHKDFYIKIKDIDVKKATKGVIKFYNKYKDEDVSEISETMSEEDYKKMLEYLNRANGINTTYNTILEKIRHYIKDG